jgi:gliding motility-associated-like protein
MRKILRGHVFIKEFLFTLGVGLFFFGDSQAQVSGTYTINSAVATGGTNFHSFTDAVAFLQSGLSGSVVFNVQAGSGPYNEQLYLGSAIGATASKTVTFNCNGVTLTYLSTNTNQRAVVKLDNADYITFDNLIVRPLAATSGQYGYGFHLLNDADNNTIKNCTITCNTNTSAPANIEGIVINGNNQAATASGTSNCDNNLIQTNTISGGNAGITLSSVPVSGSPVYMSGNRIVGNVISGGYTGGIWMAYNDGTVVSGNDISNSSYSNANESGIYLANINTNVQVTSNRIHNLHASASNFGSTVYGINVSCTGVAGKENLVANNLIYDFANDYLEVGIAASDATASYCNIYHNTISMDDASGNALGAYGFSFFNISNFNVINNIASITAQTQVQNYGVWLDNPLGANVTFDKNDYYMAPGPAGLIAIGKDPVSGNDALTIAQWRSWVGVDLHAASSNPQFTNAAAYNFVPLSQTLDNMGKPVGITTDFTGAARSTTNPDPGCYEFASTPCTTPVTAGTLQVSDTSVCTGITVSWSLAEGTYSAGSGQTYTWQSASTPTGTFANASGALVYPSYEVTPATRSSLYYRVAVTCGATTAYTNVVKLRVNGSLPAGTYTINSALPSSNINFQSYNEAIDNLKCAVVAPVVFNVVPGTHYEQLVIPTLTTSAVNTVTFKGNGDTLNCSITDINHKAAIKLDGADYITFDSIVVLARATSVAFGVQLTNNADHNTISRCRIFPSTTKDVETCAGIVINGYPDNPIIGVSNCDSNLVYGNTITGGFYGITCVTDNSAYPAGSGIATAVGNKLVGNTIRDFNTYGIYLSALGATLVDSNDISQPTRVVTSLKSASALSGIYCGAPTTTYAYGVKITRNRIHDLLYAARTNPGIQVNGITFERAPAIASAPGIVSNNLLYNLYGAGYMYGLYNLSCDYIKYYNNTVSMEDTGSIAALETRGFGLFSTASTTVGGEFKNNNIVIRRGGTGTKTAIFLNINDSNLVANNNNYLVTAAKGTNITGLMGGINYPTLANWLAVRKDSASIAMDPLFADPSIGDYTPGYLPFDNRGMVISGVTNDIQGLARSTTKPDIGAYEFTICYPISSPVVKIDSLGVYSVRFSWTSIPYASGYMVSRDGGISWVKPSSGNLGTTHTITGLKPLDTVSLMVKVLGTRWDCPVYYSNVAKAQTMTDQIFIPNTFTPNGNGQNDVFKVYSNIVRSMRMSIYNQWGEKVFETSDVNGTWDGTYKGKPQPVGVYVYVVTMVLTTDGSQQVKKGTFNLIR